MAKLTLSTISSRYASVAALNANFDAIEEALENTLSRNGTSPNDWVSDQDAGGKRLLNLPDPIADSEPATKGWVESAPGSAAADAAIATAAAADAVAAAAVIDGFEWGSQWLTATAYAVNNLVYEAGNTYICLVAHTSGTFGTDFGNGKWELFASKGAAGAGTGDMLGANNLSDLTDFATARATLGVQPTASPTFTGTVTIPTPTVGDNSTKAASTAFVSTAISASPTVPTGAVTQYIGSSAPSGWVMLSGRTLGNGSSGGTERANADTETLYTLLWNSFADAEAPVATGRGASAAADFAANKTITLPDARGRVLVGKDNMGGTTASRITNAGSGIVGTTLGASGGAQNVTLTAAESGLPSHSHTTAFYGPGTGASAPSYGAAGEGSTATSLSTSSAGGSAASSAHTNVQPTLVVNVIIKL